MNTHLPAPCTAAISSLLENAHTNGRSMLYEHEVYAILQALELRVPTHNLLQGSGDITPDLLGRYMSSKIVLKAVINGLAHKQKAGGVRIVHKDRDFIRYSIDQMLTELNSQGYIPEGVLLVEWVEYSQDLGNEIMLGFRESDSFGPVISFSKGGSDAEHFARHFSPPNLILAPINRKWAEALLYSTSIQEKYRDQGKTNYTDTIIEAGLKFSQLATTFSNFFDNPSSYILREFEVNPFIFDPYGNFIALDGYAVFEKREKKLPEAANKQPSIAPFFRPQGIAVAGVSTSNRSSPGSIIAMNLVKLGRRDIYFINPKGGRTQFEDESFPIYPNLAAIDEQVDLVVISVPASHVFRAMQECGKKGVKAVILIPGGFSETGDSTLENKILHIAKNNGIRLIGPNCLGILYSGNNHHAGVNTFFIPEEKFQLNKEHQENVAILSQSGALGLTEIHNLRHAISPKVIVSYGNALDIDPSDLIAHFAHDPEIDIIGCYIEGFKKGAGARFFATATHCTKPIIVYKAGRTEEGRMATESHTASIAGEYEVSKAAMKQAGLIVADTMMDHTELIKTFALLHNFKVNGNRVAIIANAGYEKTYAADNLDGLRLADFDQKTWKELEKIMPSFVNVEPLLDLTPMADDALFERCIDIVLASDSVDAVFISIVPHAMEIHTTDKEIGHHENHVAARIIRLVHTHKKPVVVSTNVTAGADVVYNKFGQAFDTGGVPTFLTASRAMKCLNAFIRYYMVRETNNFGEWLKHSP